MAEKVVIIMATQNYYDTIIIIPYDYVIGNNAIVLLLIFEHLLCITECL